MTGSTNSFSVNGREYRPGIRPIVVICLDGSAEEYLIAAQKRGFLPHLQQMGEDGFRATARAALPTFTNVNNASIITGVPPSVHGISGNFFYDETTGEERMMNSAAFLRADTIPGAAARAGRRVAVVTAKDKLRDIFAHGLAGIAFSAEKARDARASTHGIDAVETVVGRPTPEIYSAEASLFVLQAGVALLRRELADFLYLSTTDYVQHLYGPEEKEALEFYRTIDHEVGKLLGLGAIVAVTADHGMNAKQRADGQPNVIYLERDLETEFDQKFRVILPITDPYVLHHGALGSFACVHAPRNVDIETVRRWLITVPGITEVYARDTAASLLELPQDRIGDLVVLSDRDVVLGRRPRDHDLNALPGGLRSHGGRFEEMVPFLMSEKISPRYQEAAGKDLRNFDIFDFAVNGGQAR